MNSVEDYKKVVYLLSGFGGKAYAVLKNLVPPCKYLIIKNAAWTE